MTLPHKRIWIFIVIFAVFVSSARAMDVIDLYYGAQTWTMRWAGYRNYRVPVKISSGKTCIISLTAHANPSPKVDEYTLLIHGFGDSRFMWWKFIERYKDHPDYGSFIAIDLPLHGHSNCDSVEEWDEIVGVLHQTVKNFGRGPITRIIGQSLGVIPTALLADKYPQAQQVWFTPPLLAAPQLKVLVGELLDLKTQTQVQAFMNRVLTKQREFPAFIRSEMLVRIEKSQRILRKTNTAKVGTRILSKKYSNLLIVTAAKDALVPPADLDARVALLTTREIAAVPCGHDILRSCGEDVKSLVEASRVSDAKAPF